MLFRSCFAAALCALIAHLPQAVSQRADSPIRDFTLEELSEAMDDPDALGEFSIPDPSGFDLSEEWPGSAAVPGWKARIEIKANVPVTSSAYTTLTRISYVPPESVPVTSNATSSWTIANRTWYPCSHLWIPSALTASLDEVQASCSGTIPDDCKNDILESLRESFSGDFDFDFPGPHCPFTSLPDSCRSTFGNDTRLLGAEPSENSDLSSFNLNTWYYYEAPDVHGKNDDTVYRAALERVWILGTAWGYSKYSEFANGTNLDINATITCLRADEDASPSSADEDSGVGNLNIGYGLPVVMFIVAGFLLGS